MELQWPLILFTTFIAWSAGLFATQGWYLIKGKDGKAQMTALITSFVLMAVGGICVFFHLQHWERIFNGFGHITSGITQELVCIVIMFIIMVLVFVYLRRSGEEAKVPKWVAVLAIVSAALLVIIMGHSYMMASHPTWNSVFQIISLLGAACAFGPATMAVICELKGDDAELHGQLNFIGQIINVACVIVYIIAMALAAGDFTSVAYWFDPVSPTQTMVDATTLSPFSGSTAIVTVAAIVCAALGVVAGYMGKKQGKWKMWGGIGIVAVLASTILLRVVFYQMGVSVYPFF